MLTCCFVSVVTACAKKNPDFDLYELHPVTAAPADNDTYYVPPRSHSMCSINDAPDCGIH